MPRPVAPTLALALEELHQQTKQGFVFVRPDGSERALSFAEIHTEVVRRGANFSARGLEKGDRLALVIPDGDEVVLSFLAAIWAGVVPLPMYPQLSFKNVETSHDTISHSTRAS